MERRSLRQSRNVGVVVTGHGGPELHERMDDSAIIL
jgi:hypothetical protein